MYKVGVGPPHILPEGLLKAFCSSLVTQEKDSDALIIRVSSRTARTVCESPCKSHLHLQNYLGALGWLRNATGGPACLETAHPP